MTRFAVRVALPLILAGSLVAVDRAGACALEISLACTTPQGSGTCTATTRNVATQSCSGFFYSGLMGPQGSSVRFAAAAGAGECFSSGDFPEYDFGFPWLICFDQAGSLGPGQTRTLSAHVSGAQGETGIEAFTAFLHPETGDLIAFASTFDTVEVPTCVPTLSSPGAVRSAVPYEVRWTAVAQPGATYEIEESTSPNFDANLVRRTTSSLSSEFSHSVAQTTTYHYRVRAQSCGGAPGAWSRPSTTVVSPPAPPTASRFDVAVPFGSRTPVTQQVFIPGPGGSTSFSASVDQPWVTVSPATGTIGPSGVTLTLTMNPADLPVGASTSTLTVSFGSGKNAASSHQKTVPVSVSLVTPVSSGGKSSPPANALVIPAVAHVAGGAFFQSDVRLSNNTGSSVDYDLFFTPSNQNGLEEGRRTTIRLTPGQTVALNDVVKNFFGYAEESASIGGSMEIRPLRTSSTLSFASSRTYATTVSGTLGQFIPAVPIAKFIGVPVVLPGQPPPSGPPAVISLQQIASSQAFRTNIGLAEASGQPAQGRIRIFDASGSLVREDPFELQPAEHRQFALSGLELPDGRLEVVVDSPTGQVTSYASVIDNVTQDPFFVAPVRPSDIRARRYVLPGVAALDRPTSNFFSDVRIYNGGSAATAATLRYFPQGSDSAAATASVSIAAGEVKAWNNVLQSLFGLSETGGALVVETPQDSSLVVTGRTYSRATAGSYGQFIPAVTSSDGTAAGERPLEILQIEQSPEFRTNLGLVELTGNPADVEIVLSIPGSTVSPVIARSLKANEFVQLNSVLATANVGTAYNVRATVRVVGGSGRVAAYASVIDNRTVDPTYVPAQ